MLLSILFWLFVVLVVISFVCTLALPVGTKRSDYSVASKVVGLLSSVLAGLFYYLVYQTGVI